MCVCVCVCGGGEGEVEVIGKVVATVRGEGDAVVVERW